MTISQVADDTTAFSLYPALDDDSASASVSSTSDDKHSVKEVEDEYYGRKALRTSLKASSSTLSRTSSKRSSSTRSSSGANFIEMVGTTSSSAHANAPLESINGQLSGLAEEENGETTMRNIPPQSRVDDAESNRWQSNKSNPIYDNWSFEDINLGIISRTQTKTSNNDNNASDTVDDLAWRIIRVVLKGWCLIWVLFAIMVIAAELVSPKHHSTSSKNQVMGTKSIVTIAGADEQIYLEISEQIIIACSYSNLDTEEGREVCQKKCQNHMCCFIGDDYDADDDLSEFASNKYGCADDPDKMCAAYAGCESLVLSEEDAIIYDVNGVDVFGDSADVIADKEQPQSSSTQSVTTSSNTSTSSATAISSPSSSSTLSTSSELQLIKSVVSSVCSPNNLHSRHGLMECASLCNPSMCCFDRSQIEELNPKMDLILKMEGLGSDILDRSAMGTCIEKGDKDAGDANVNATIQSIQSPFCEVHAGCKNLLLLGAPSKNSKAKKQNPSLALNKHTLIFSSMGIYDSNGDNQIMDGSSSNAGTDDDQERMLVTICTLFGLIIGLSVYLLVFKRQSSRATIVGITMALRHGGRRRVGDNGSTSDSLEGHGERPLGEEEEMVDLQEVI